MMNDSLTHMEINIRQNENEYYQDDGQSLELLDLLFNCEDGILHHGCSAAESIWTPSDPNENESFLSALMLSTDSPSDSNLWSPAASDSGISEDTHSDNHSSPLQYQCTDYSYVASNFTDFQEPDVTINLEQHVDTWADMMSQNNNSEIKSQMTDMPITVKDLLLSGSFDLQASGQPQNGRNAGSCGELVLTEDERKLLSKEGVVLPTQLPLTKYEERVLKKIRRKIRNKQSAQESRKKKKEYMDGLETRMSAYAAQNQELQRKVLQLEKNNVSLLEQLRKLQTLVSQSAGKATQTSTCVAVLLLSFSLIMFPTMNQFARKKLQVGNDFLPVRVFSRSLQNSAFSRVFHFPSEDEDTAQWRYPHSQIHKKELKLQSSLDVILSNQTQRSVQENQIEAQNQTEQLNEEDILQMNDSIGKELIELKGDSVTPQVIMQISLKETSNQGNVIASCVNVTESDENV